MKVKLRAQQIIIDVPRSTSEPWISITVQRVEFDEITGKEMNVVDRWGSIHKRLSSIAYDKVDYFEIMAVGENEITMFALADAIKVTAVGWIVEKYGGTKNFHGDVVL